MWNQNGLPLNIDAMRDVAKINEKIEEELKKPYQDPKELEKLYWQQLCTGMMINTGIIGNRNFRPY
jgi:hypothetical protein